MALMSPSSAGPVKRSDQSFPPICSEHPDCSPCHVNETSQKAPGRGARSRCREGPCNSVPFRLASMVPVQNAQLGRAFLFLSS